MSINFYPTDLNSCLGLILGLGKKYNIFRLNSGIRNRYNFFMRFFEKFEYLFQKIGSDSVNHAISWDIKVLVQFPGNSIVKFFTNF